MTITTLDRIFDKALVSKNERFLIRKCIICGEPCTNKKCNACHMTKSGKKIRKIKSRKIGKPKIRSNMRDCPYCIDVTEEDCKNCIHYYDCQREGCLND